MEKHQSRSISSEENMAIVAEGPPRLQTLLCFLGLLIMNLVVAIDTTAVSVSLAAVSKDVNASFTDVYYTGIAFLLAWTVFQPVFISLAALSRKGIIISAFVSFMIGLIISATAKSSWTLIFGRAVQGVGGGGVMAMTYVLMADLFTLEERAKFVSLLTLVYLVGTSAGPLLGGGLASHASWRWIFWIQVPLTAIALVVVPIFTNPVKLPFNKIQILKRIDWVGMIGFAIGTTLLLVVLSISGVSWPWSNWKAPTGIVVAIAILVVTFTLSYTWNGIRNPMIPLVVIYDRTAAINFFSTFTQGCLQSAIIYYLPLFFQTARPFSPLKAGLLLLPSCAISSMISLATGILVSKTKKLKLYSIIGWALFTFGQIPLSAGVLNAKRPVVAWIFLNVPQALGNGILIVTATLSVQASAEYRTSCSPEERVRVKAMAAALNPFFRALGNTIGVVIGETVVSNELRKRLGQDEASNILYIVKNLHGASAIDKARYIDAVIKSLDVLWLVLNILAAMNLVLCFFTKDFDFEKDGEPELLENTENGIEVAVEHHVVKLG